MKQSFTFNQDELDLILKSVNCSIAHLERVNYPCDDEIHKLYDLNDRICDYLSEGFEPCYTLVLNSFEWHSFRCLLDDYDDPDLNNLFPGDDWQDFVNSCDGKPIEYLRDKLDTLLHDEKGGEEK